MKYKEGQKIQLDRETVDYSYKTVFEIVGVLPPNILFIKEPDCNGMVITIHKDWADESYSLLE